MLPITIIALAYLLGIIGGLYNFCIVPFCLLICTFFRKEKFFIIYIIFFLVGFLLTIYRLNLFDKKYVNGQVNFTAQIISNVIEKENTNSFIIKNSEGDRFILYSKKNNSFDYGTKIVLNGTLSLPQTTRNRRWI